MVEINIENFSLEQAKIFLYGVSMDEDLKKDPRTKKLILQAKRIILEKENRIKLNENQLRILENFSCE